MTAQLRPFRTACLVTFLAFAALPPLTHAGAPAVTAKQAAQLAEDALAAKNAPGVYIQSIVLVKATLLGGKTVWSVTWSDFVPGSKPDSKEVGLEIAMDGDVTHIIKGRGKSAIQPSPH